MAPERKIADLREPEQDLNWGALCAVSNWADGPGRLKLPSVFFGNLKKPPSMRPEEELI